MSGPLEVLRLAAVEISIDGNDLVASPVHRLNDELRDLIRQHRAEILESLHASSLAVTDRVTRACEGLSISPAQLEEELRFWGDYPDVASGALTDDDLRLVAETLAVMRGFGSGG